MASVRLTQPRFTPAPIILRKLVVVRAESLTPHMRRVVVGGPELGAFRRDGLDLPAFASPAFDDHVKLIFAPGGDLADALPVQRARSIDWLPSEVRETRDYTPIVVDEETIAFDFVIHSSGSAAERGPAEAWASAARPGDDVWLVGPKSSTVVPTDVDWALLIGDETALPALRRFFTERPVAGPVRAVVAVPAEAARQPLGERDDDHVTWVIAEPGDPRALIDAVTALPRPPGRPYVWAAAESRALLPIRKFVKRELDADKSNTDITGYWHRRAAETAQAEPAAAGDDGAGSAVVDSPVSWFAVRAALQLGLLEAVDAATLDRGGVAAAIGVDPHRLDPLLDLLLACRVLATVDGSVTLGEVGDDLLTDEHCRERFDGADADAALLVGDLADALRAGESVPQRRFGRSHATGVHDDPDAYAELVEQAERLAFLVPGIGELPGLADPGVAFAGPGAAVVAEGLSRAGVLSGRATIVTAGEPDGVRDTSSPLDGLTFREAWTDHDTVVLVYALGYRDDVEARTVLAEARRYARRLVMVEPVAGDALDPRYLEAAVVSSAAVGRGPRDAAELADLAADAGWAPTAQTALGWGVTAVVCERS
ncbi:siderophore-interacting protein [Gordonia hydrophobica]|uniref:Siderophore-interacting protein n=1 Tax=Gordonia hydrophobica TaxID=40516 RepID=A0ABZ2TY67_9ACTN|nr:siderophore-interacting protein [Gordonia hydrophobica]MBM7366984.1 NADPH-dependent ferric siderophore reductase [Gordonia hydrophobica]